MGNCQAAEAATVLIQHPGGGRTERAYWALSAAAVMAANPGHYVAAVIATTQPAAAGGAASASASAPVKHLKLLRPDDTLLLGRVYRLVSFEEVLREFASKRHVKLSRVTIRAKDEDQEMKPAAKHRRRRASGAGAGGERRESDRSLAKVMRQTEEPEPAGPSLSSSGPSTTRPGHAAAADLDAELEALLRSLSEVVASDGQPPPPGVFGGQLYPHPGADAAAGYMMGMGHVHMALAMDKVASLGTVLRQADELRMQALHALRQILTARQAARCFVAVDDYFCRLRALSTLWATSRTAPQLARGPAG